MLLPNANPLNRSIAVFHLHRSRKSGAVSESPLPSGTITMSLLKWALIALIVAGIAALFGFGGIAEGATDVAKVLFFIFVAICAILFLAGVFTYRAVT
jgi:uncharacterized membrane protein YtjA (UPF0391 family)